MLSYQLCLPPFSIGFMIIFSLLIRLYQYAFLIASPLVCLLIHWRVKKGLEDQDRFHERYGHINPKTAIFLENFKKQNVPIIWFHAASVGETLSIKPIVAAWKRKHPEHCIIMTTVTRTSAKIVETQFCPHMPLVFHQYAPFDHPLWVKKFLTSIKPCQGFFVESEIWPTLLTMAHHLNIPLTLMNGRISDRSFKRWRLISFLAVPLFSCFERVFAQNQESKDRLGVLGAKNVRYPGNLKFLSTPPEIDDHLLHGILKIKKKNLMILAASTHNPEEDLFLKALMILKENLSSDFKLPFFCMIPRHPHRAKEIVDYAGARGFKAFSLTDMENHLKREGEGILPIIDILVIDRIGIMGSFFATADLTFIGGSFTNHGGHNPIEPAWFKQPIITGPYMYNFKDICHIFGSSLYTIDATSLAIADVIQSFLKDSSHHNPIVQKGQDAYAIVVDQHQQIQTLMDQIIP